MEEQVSKVASEFIKQTQSGGQMHGKSAAAKSTYREQDPSDGVVSVTIFQ
jgi:hypothetical protein